MRTVTYYNFTELTEGERKAFYDKSPEKFAPDDQWYEFTLESIKDALESIGFYDVKIGFSGFWSQGDGAHFTGSYRYTKGALTKVRADYPEWVDLHVLAESLQKLEAKDLYSVWFKITHRGHYQHENCTSFDFENTRHDRGFTRDDFPESDYIEACREFMRHIYGSLEKEYDYLSSWEYVKENPEAFEFIEMGRAL